MLIDIILLIFVFIIFAILIMKLRIISRSITLQIHENMQKRQLLMRSLGTGKDGMSREDQHSDNEGITEKDLDTREEQGETINHESIDDSFVNP